MSEATVYIGKERLPASDWIDHKTDAGASALYGVFTALEAREFDGNMAMTGAMIDKALELFLEDVVANGGAEMAGIYAERLIQGLQRFTMKG